MRTFVMLVATLIAIPLAFAADEADHPPPGSQLAFVRDGQIWLLDPDGAGLLQLTDSGSDVLNRDPAWSPDGRRLAFSRGSVDGQSSEIYVMDADGSNVIQVTSEGSAREPAWGPDGHTIAFTSLISGSEGLSLIDVDADDNDGSWVLLDRPAYDVQPAWSPDGNTITFTSDFNFYDFTYDLGAINMDGTDVRFLLQGAAYYPGTYYFQSAWSPDGQRIAVVRCTYAVEDCYPYSAIAVMSSDGSGFRVIAQAGGYSSPTWSPDGRWIAFGSTSCSSCESSLHYVRADGATEGLMVENGHSPAWRPETGASINVGHSGAWFNPATSGQGLFLDVDPDGGFAFLGWFTYTDEASDAPNEQHWFTAQGNYSGSKAELTLYESFGGRFEQPQAVTTTAVGTVTLTFSDCDNGTLSYHFDDRNLEGNIPLVRATPGSGNLCETRADWTTQAVMVNPGMDGAWFDPDTSGQGFFFDVHAGEDDSQYLFVAWFSYGDDTASGQRWLTAQGQFEGLRADLAIHDTRGGSFNDPRAVESVQVGTMSIDFSDCSNALLSFSLDDEHVAGEHAISRLMPGSLCEELSAAQ